VWAFALGSLRGIPAWWRLIDSAFGVVGFVPMWLCRRWAGELEVELHRLESLTIQGALPRASATMQV
jgi:hypothetical protein